MIKGYHEIRRRIPGILYLLLAITGFYTPYVLGHFNDISKSSHWFKTILDGGIFFESGIISYYGMNISWLLLGFLFYTMFKREHGVLAALLLISVILGGVIVFILIFFQSSPLILRALLVDVPAGGGQPWIDQAHFMFMFGDKGSIAAYFFYSLWLVPLGLLFLKEKSISRIEGIVLFISLCIASAGYMVDFLLFHISVVSSPIGFTRYTFIGEVILLLWLLVKGVPIREEPK